MTMYKILQNRIHDFYVKLDWSKTKLMYYYHHVIQRYEKKL